MVSDDKSRDSEVSTSSVDQIDEIDVSNIFYAVDMAERISDEDANSLPVEVFELDEAQKRIPLISASVTLWNNSLGHTATKSEVSRLLQDEILSMNSVVSLE